jgi:NAD(P)-dependent dehydrogenase (short-subunit alcohol dehydrogenase family)
MRRVFITGASSGLGAAFAAHYASQGASLGLLARRGDALRALIASLPHPERHHAYVADVTDHAALRAAAADFIGRAEAAGDRVDIVIASAGVSHGTLTEHAEDLAVFDTIMATNVNATVATFAPFIASMKRRPERDRPARLVGIASVAGIRGLPGAGAYSASKAAVISYCESLRLELQPHGIRVVTIAPGYIDTPMTEKNTYRMPFLMPAAQFAATAAAAIESGTSYRVIPWQMGVVAKLLRALPNAVYDRLFINAPHKARKVAASGNAGAGAGRTPGEGPPA